MSCCHCSSEIGEIEFSEGADGLGGASLKICKKGKAVAKKSRRFDGIVCAVETFITGGCDADILTFVDIPLPSTFDISTEYVEIPDVGGGDE